MIALPKWLYGLLVPIVFVAATIASLFPIWNGLERMKIHAVSEADRPLFPVLVQSIDHRYHVSTFGDILEPSKLVTAISTNDQFKINEDLRRSIENSGSYQYFKILADENGQMTVEVEVPTIHDSVKKGWYSISAGRITPLRMVTYGPGFAFLVLPPAFLLGAICLFGYTILFRRESSAMV